MAKPTLRYDKRVGFTTGTEEQITEVLKSIKKREFEAVQEVLRQPYSENLEIPSEP